MKKLGNRCTEVYRPDLVAKDFSEEWKDEKAQNVGSSQYFGKRCAVYVTITWDVWGEQNLTPKKSLVSDDKGDQSSSQCFGKITVGMLIVINKIF